jgi:hypothetical protein
MIKRASCWAIFICLVEFVLLGNPVAVRQEAAQAQDVVLQWGGPGYDHARAKKGSTRFAANIGKDDDTAGKAVVEILVDSKKTWGDLAQLSLRSRDGTESVTSIRRWKSQRHITAPWICVFFAAEIKQLPDDGLIVAWDSNGKQILSEKTDFRRIKAMIADPERNKTKPLPNETDAGDGK